MNGTLYYRGVRGSMHILFGHVFLSYIVGAVNSCKLCSSLVRLNFIHIMHHIYYCSNAMILTVTRKLFSKFFYLFFPLLFFSLYLLFNKKFCTRIHVNVIVSHFPTLENSYNFKKKKKKKRRNLNYS